MPRIAGALLKDEKRIEVGLTAVFGIGPNVAKKILKDTGVSPDLRIKDLKAEDLEKLRSYIEKNLIVEGELRSRISQNIKRLKDISSYRGVRHSLRLPVRGQRTKTNARTKRGKKVTIGSGRKKSSDKT